MTKLFLKKKDLNGIFTEKIFSTRPKNRYSWTGDKIRKDKNLQIFCKFKKYSHIIMQYVLRI